MQDRFGREISYLRISLTDRCNLRCRYCMPEKGVNKRCHGDILSLEEIEEIAAAAVELGIRKIRLTGGEPLVRKGMLSLCRALSALPGLKELALTTNGILLPAMARALKAAGVSRVNISLDTLDPEKYHSITRCGVLEDALSGIRSALEAGMGVKINSVLIGGFNDDEIPALAGLTRQYPLDVRFIELMPIGDAGIFDRSAYIPSETVLQAVPELQPAGSRDGVSSLYRYPDGLGRVGLIHPMSCSFCSECNRIRLTADGCLKPCLHSAEEIPLRGLHGDDLKEAILNGVNHKPEHHHLNELSLSEAARNMNEIGG